MTDRRTCPECSTSNEGDARFCKACGSRIPADVPSLSEVEALPTAVLRERVNEAAAAPEPPPDPAAPWEPGTTVDPAERYHVVTKLGKGGFGQAYLAFDSQLRRSCVIKRQVMRERWSEKARASAIRNFEREAQLLVTLNSPGHPNIPEIYEYLASNQCLIMKYIEGQDLERVLKQHPKGLPEAEALGFLRDVCSALVYMHSRPQEAVLHRDIKPANILLDSSGRVWLVDFGLSKATPIQANIQADLDTSDPTKTMVAGTIGYSAPEQWLAKASPRSDVYALAATLHTMITGYRPPFKQSDLPAILAGRKGAFPPARQINPNVSSAVEQLIQRCMAHNERYRPSAAELLSEIDTILHASAGRPAIQTPTGASITSEAALAEWCEANWDEAIVWLYSQNRLADQLEHMWSQNKLAADLRKLVARYAQDRNAGLDALLALLDPDGFGAEEPRLTGPRVLDFGALATDGRADQSLSLNNTGRRYVPLHLRLPAWVIQTSQVFGLLPGQQAAVVLQADMRRATAGGNLRDTITIHDGNRALGRVEVRAAVSRWRTLWERATTGRRPQTWEQVARLKGHSEPVWALAFSRDQRTLASGSGDDTIKLWRIGESQPVQSLASHTNMVVSLAYTPDGQMLVSASTDTRIKFWQAQTGALLYTLDGHLNTTSTLAFSPDGKMLASGGGDSLVKLWSMRTGELIQSMADQKAGVISLAFSPDGHLLAGSSSDGLLNLWRMGDYTHIHSFRGHSRPLRSIAFSPDGRWLAGGGDDSLVRLWNVRDGDMVAVLGGEMGHRGTIYAVAFSPNGELLASAGRDATIRLWQPAAGGDQKDPPLVQMLEPEHGSTHCLAFRADGALLAAGGDDKSITLWQVQ